MLFAIKPTPESYIALPLLELNRISLYSYAQTVGMFSVVLLKPLIPSLFLSILLSFTAQVMLAR